VIIGSLCFLDAGPNFKTLPLTSPSSSPRTLTSPQEEVIFQEIQRTSQHGRPATSSANKHLYFLFSKLVISRGDTIMVFNFGIAFSHGKLLIYRIVPESLLVLFAFLLKSLRILFFVSPLLLNVHRREEIRLQLLFLVCPV
jgi:hypothetical protein